MNIKHKASSLKFKIAGLGVWDFRLHWTKVGFVIKGFVLVDKQTNAGNEMEYVVLT